MVGNIPNFLKFDVLRCFLKLDIPKSRLALSMELELGEGTIRSILDVLKNKKLLASNKKGHCLNNKGEKLYNSIIKNICLPKETSLGNLYKSQIKMGIIIRNSKLSRQTYKLRDIAVKNGADGAIIFIFDKKLRTPEKTSISFSNLAKVFELKQKDILVIAFSASRRNAENGVLSIAAELDRFTKKVVDSFEK